MSPEPDTDTQLDIFGDEIPVEELPEPEQSPQIGVDDRWPDDCYQPTT